ncbi:hypothetical protein CkaCkLH20_03910 [Colletotrichum karsti]|uniref:Helicase C-terminal domain-containing protein n=1 Tax=Colletotrichum karsti TaxID=1095194 RepID=A0A9P6I8Q2_9PEZI|nr:uncharacterized protein CkaCkLH20_03910 [Colletotrichum karsti]KAF9878418.1 hypothetical protein CkaCkLH20_03910 [Colletotrichum karsti]
MGADILLMTLGTGAVGLNLAVASRIYLFEPQWNPSIELQAFGRALRLGQAEQVVIVRYIMRGTIEDSNVLSRQQKKLQLADGGFSQKRKPISSDRLEAISNILGLELRARLEALEQVRKYSRRANEELHAAEASLNENTQNLEAATAWLHHIQKIVEAARGYLLQAEQQVADSQRKWDEAYKLSMTAGKRVYQVALYSPEKRHLTEDEIEMRRQSALTTFHDAQEQTGNVYWFLPDPPREPRPPRWKDKYNYAGRQIYSRWQPYHPRPPKPVPPPPKPVVIVWRQTKITDYFPRLG